MDEQPITRSPDKASTLIVGDLHLAQGDILPRIDAAIERFGIGRVVLLGNYCDQWSRAGTRAAVCILIQGLGRLRSWVIDHKAAGVACEVLLGNHDMQYVLGASEEDFEPERAKEVTSLLADMDATVASEAAGFLITHAGLTQAFSEANLDATDDADEVRDGLNALLASGTDDALGRLAARGPAGGGQDLPGPLWADAAELTDDPAHGVDQIVGNTPVPTCRRAFCTGRVAGRAPRIYLCDTYSLDAAFRPLGDGSMLRVGEDDLAVITSEDLGIEPWA